MDSLRGAFSQVDYDERTIAINNVNNNFVKYTNLWPNGTTAATQVQHSTVATGTVLKMNHNLNHESAFIVNSTKFENYLNSGNNALFFGWRGASSGYGIKEFGSMLANSKAFPRCMAKRVYESTCKRSPASFDAALIQQAADEFENGGYKMKTLFEVIASSDSCLGK
jgi:hypothetical protein